MLQQVDLDAAGGLKKQAGGIVQGRFGHAVRTGLQDGTVKKSGLVGRGDVPFIAPGDAEISVVAQDAATQRYFLGQAAIHIGLAALRQCEPIRAGEPALLRLQAELGVTCFIAVMGNLGPTILRIEEPPLAVVVNVRAGSVLPLLWSATGQVFLALGAGTALPAQARQEWALATPRQRAVLPEPAAIDALCQQVRVQGFASVQDLLLPGISAAAAPLRRHDGAVVGALTALGATGGFDARPGGDAVGRLCAAAASVSAQLGFLNASPQR